jgi:hypothetical protein
MYDHVTRCQLRSNGIDKNLVDLEVIEIVNRAAISPTYFYPADHPLRPIRELVNVALKLLNGLFNLIYVDTGRASIAMEKLMQALLLQVF